MPNTHISNCEVQKILDFEEEILNETAIQHGEKNIPYRDLMTDAQKIACELNRHRNGELYVGLSVCRSPNAFVAMLGILLAGGTCVPVDVNQPQDYRTKLFKKAGCAVVFSDAPLPDLTCPVWSVEKIIKNKTTAGAISPDQGSPGFVLFTSGTTGEPKGVILDLDALINVAQNFASRTGLNEKGTVAQFAGLSFDAAILEFLLALTLRAKLRVLSDEARVEPETLSRELRAHDVTHLLLPAAVAPYLALRDDYNLKAFIVIGDVLEEQVFHAWAEKYRTFNGYGPTESAICTCLHEVQPGKPVELGKPLSHVRLKVGGDHGNELLIAGPGLSKGYLNDPDRTADRFRPDANGVVWYHTGDQVIQDPTTKDLRFAGRLDFQAKINGARVEVTAVETALKGMGATTDAVVIACTAEGGQKYLAAFLASASPEKDLIEAARAHLTEIFPASHIPSVFRVLPKLPLTVNQKTDRRALEQSLTNLEAGNGRDAVRTAFLSELKLNDCDENADFFHLGGTSIGAMRFLARLEALTGQHVPVKRFRNAPTIKGLRALLQDKPAQQVRVGAHQLQGDTLPLSAQQNTAWFMHLQNPNSKAYIAEAIHYFDGALDVMALEEVLQELISTHEIYRTVFREKDGVPMQKILPEAKVEIHHIDASDTPHKERQAVLQKVLGDKLPGIPDLSTLPLVKFALVRFGETEHAFIHQEHHIVHDGWGGSSFTAELLNRYHKRTQKEFDYTPAQPAQYSDYVLAQQDWLNSSEAKDQLAYWCKQLKDAPQGVSLFGKKSQGPGFEGGFCRLDFSRDEWLRSENRCRELGVTPYGFTTAVLNLLLWQYSGQTDIVMGAPFANRNWQNTHDILGMFVNTTVLRQKINPNQRADDFIRSMQVVVNEAYANQELPFGKLVETLNPERLSGQNPIFNVIMGFHDTPIPVAEVDGFRWHKDETVTSNSTKFDLNCLVVNRDNHFSEDNRVSFLWEYRNDVYDACEIRDFVDSFRQAFLALCDNASMPLGEIPFLTATQKDKLTLWGTGPEPSPNNRLSAMDFAEAITERLPHFGDKVAIQTTNDTLTYTELDRQSSVLAGAIAAQVAPNDCLAIYAPRGAQQVVAMVAAVKLRATIVCLDDSLPKDRCDQILGDCAPSLILKADPDALQDVPFPSATIGTVSEGNVAFPKRSTPPDYLVYITYTSGSTGKPKGVKVSGQNLGDACLDLIDVLALSENASLLSQFYVGFDAYHGEIWPALISGSAIVMVSDSERTSLETLSDIMVRFNVTSAFLPTGLFEQACSSGFVWPDSIAALAVGGDKLGSVSLPPTFDARFYNLYGPSETTIHATSYELTNKDFASPPIGRPRTNTKVQIMDGARLCPPGSVGELVIGGTGVAEGYLNRPKETQHAFTTLQDGTRCYRSGDKVRWQSDGQLMFLGRIDDEISLRGYRIAPAEITVILQRHPDVAQATVAVKNAALFAYVTRKPGAEHMSDAELSQTLKTNLKRSLPEYMVPNSIVVIETMPLMDQGKINKSALPLPEAAAESFTRPETDTEHRLLELWQELLPVKEISTTQNFFSSGGHSLLAMRLIASIQANFGVAISMNDFFEFGTIQLLAEKIDLIQMVSQSPPEAGTSIGEF